MIKNIFKDTSVQIFLLKSLSNEIIDIKRDILKELHSNSYKNQWS